MERRGFLKGLLLAPAVAVKVPPAPQITKPCKACQATLDECKPHYVKMQPGGSYFGDGLLDAPLDDMVVFPEIPWEKIHRECRLAYERPR